MSALQRWDQLYETASGQLGYFTTAQAQAMDFSDQLLEHHLRTGRLKRVQRGIYRLSHFPYGDYDDLVILWLWSRQSGVFSHTTALALHQLSDLIPNFYHLTLPLSWKSRRLQVKTNVELHYSDIPPDQRGWYGCVPVTRVARTLADCEAIQVSREFLDQAVQEATTRGIYSGL